MSPTTPPGLTAPCHLTPTPRRIAALRAASALTPRRIAALRAASALTPHRIAALCAATAALCLSSAAAGAPPRGAEPDPDPLDVLLDSARRELTTQDAPAGALAFGVQAQLRISSQEHTTFGAFAFLQVPLDHLAAPPRRALVNIAEPPPAPDATPSAPAPPPAPLLSPDLARGAVRAACKAARLDDAEHRLDSLASRAKTSALLPELRLRATRAIDETESLAPTEYDPLRRTASGGSSTWLEARATFRLDRLVFADDEIAVERLRISRATERTRLVAKILELLDAWQRARAAEADPAAKPEARQRARLAAVTAEVSLDVLTGGWFSRAVRALPAADAHCDTGDARDAASDAGAAARDGATARDANDRTRDVKDSARRVRGRDAPAASTSHDAARPSPAERAATSKK